MALDASYVFDFMRGVLRRPITSNGGWVAEPRRAPRRDSVGYSHSSPRLLHWLKRKQVGQIPKIKKNGEDETHLHVRSVLPSGGCRHAILRFRQKKHARLTASRRFLGLGSSSSDPKETRLVTGFLFREGEAFAPIGEYWF